MPYKEMGEQYNNFAESCGRNHSKFSKPIYNFALFAFHLVRGFGIFNPRSSICPRLSWRRLKAGSRCRLGQQVRLNKVRKNIYCTQRGTNLFSDLQTKYLNIVSSHCNYSGEIYKFTTDHIYPDIHNQHQQTHLTFKKLL